MMSGTGHQRSLLWAAPIGVGVFLLVLVGLLLGLPTLVKLQGTGASLVMLELAAAGLTGLAAMRLAMGLVTPSERGAASTPTPNPNPLVVSEAFWKRPWMPWALIALALLMFVALALALVSLVHAVDIPNELSLPVLAIAGVVALLGSLALVAVSFNLVQMSDKTQPLGLPQGSVRAVIALSLVVLFAILTVYLFSSLNMPYDSIATCVTELKSEQMIAEGSKDGGALIRHIMNNSSVCHGIQADEFRYQVLAPRAINPAGIDFAKQLLVLIGTLVTSVASFYFGSQAVSQAQSAMAGLNVAPTLQGVSPTTLAPIRDKDVGLDLLGTGLNGARQVQLLKGGEQISAISVTSNDSRAHARFNLPVDISPDGAWDVILTDSQGRATRLAAAVAVKPAPATSDPAQESNATTTRTAPAVPAEAQRLLLGLQSQARDAAAVAQAVQDLLPLAPTIAGAVGDDASQQAAKALALVKAAIDAPSETTVTAATTAVSDALAATGEAIEQARWLTSALTSLKQATEAAGAVKAAIDNPGAEAVGTALTQASEVLKQTSGGGLGPVLADAISTAGSVLQNPAAGALIGGAGLAVPPVGIIAGILLGAWKAWSLGVRQYQRWMARVLDRPITQDLFPAAAWDGIAARTLVKSVAPLERVFGQTLDAAAPQVAAGLLALIFEPDAVEKLREGRLPSGITMPKVGEAGGFVSESEIEEAVKAVRRLVLDRAIERDSTAPVPLGSGQSAPQAVFHGAIDRLREAGAGRAIDTVGLLAGALISRASRDAGAGQSGPVDIERLLTEALAVAQAMPQQAMPPSPTRPPVETE